MSEPRKKLRYVPAPQEPQLIALTDEELRKLIRQMVREELAKLPEMIRMQSTMGRSER